MDKTDLAESGRDLWCVSAEQVVDVVTTSGTTGRPTLYPLTRRDVARLGYNEYLSFTCAGLVAADTAFLAVTMDRCFIAGLAHYEGLRQRGATAVRVGSAAPGMVLDLLPRLRPTAVVSVPSFLKVIADYAAERGVALAGSDVRRLVCIGEPVRSQALPEGGGNGRLALTPRAAELERAWGAKVYATYGATEIACSLCECEHGAGGHLHPELLHVEILDDEGNAVPDGEVGELVATTIGVEAMPVIRFRTGDLTYLTREPCACGRATPRIGPILGRKNQMLKIKGTTVYPAAVSQALEGMAEVAEFAMVATADAALSDRLEVIVSAADGLAGGEVAGRVCSRLQGQLKVTPDVRIASPAEVAAVQTVGTGRKKRIFVDRRSGGGPS